MGESFRERLRRILRSKSPKAAEAAPPVEVTPPIKATPRSNRPVKSIEVPNFDPPPSIKPVVVAPFTESGDTQPDRGQKTYDEPALLRAIAASHTRMPASLVEARVFVANVRTKMAALAEDFALGKINRQQFETIYVHYREQRQTVEALLASMSSSAWRRAVSEGKTGLLMQRTMAQVLSYALYDNHSSTLLASAGQFRLDPALVVPMLSSYRSVTAEIFGGNITSSEIEGGHWLSFVPGRYTTFIVLFSLEPARSQLTMIQDLHHDFEVANAEWLAQGRGQQPAEQFMRIWALERSS